MAWMCASVCFAGEIDQDTIYLTNGRSVKGIIVKEDNMKIELDTGFGTVVVSRAQVRSVHKAMPEAQADLKKSWKKQQSALRAKEKELEQERERRQRSYGEWVEEGLRRKAADSRAEGEVKISRDPESQSILVDAVLNGNVKATLVLDTGASIVVLSKRLGTELGIDMTEDAKAGLLELRLAGGRTVKAKAVVLESVDIQGIEEKNVMAAVLMEDAEHIGFKDGLLGRSFLGRYNLRIDLKSMVMSMQKLK